LDFHFETAYLSVTYLDRFLSKHFIDVSSNYDLPNAAFVSINWSLLFNFSSI